MSRVRFVASHLLLSSSLAFPIHVGSLVDPMAGDFPLHVALFIASTVLTPTVFMSFYRYLSTWSLVVLSFFFLVCLSSVPFSLCARRPFSSLPYNILVVSLLSFLDACVTLV